MLLHTSPVQFHSLDDWRTFIDQTFVPLEVQVRGRGGLVPQAGHCAVGPLSITELHISATTVVRTPALAKRSEQAIYKASLQLQGTSEIIQNNRRVTLTPGHWAMYDTTQPYTVHVGDDAQFLVLMIEPDLLSMWQPYLSVALARSFDTQSGCGHLVRQMLKSIIRQPQTFSDTTADSVAHALIQLMGAQLSEPFLADTPKPQTVREIQLVKIQHYIQQNLHRSDLNVDKLCQVFRCSRRYLYNLFALQDLAPADYIQRQRLISSCERLADPSYQRPIAELAYQHGFKDATAFSHAFRRRYGVSPTVWRQQQLSQAVM